MDILLHIIYSLMSERRVSLHKNVRKNVRYAENVTALTIHGYRGNKVQHCTLILSDCMVVVRLQLERNLYTSLQIIQTHSIKRYYKHYTYIIHKSVLYFLYLIIIYIGNDSLLLEPQSHLGFFFFWVPFQ